MKLGSESYDPYYIAATPTKHKYISNFKKIFSNLGTCTKPSSYQTDDMCREIERKTLLYKFQFLQHGSWNIFCHMPPLDILAFKKYENEFPSLKMEELIS